MAFTDTWIMCLLHKEKNTQLLENDAVMRLLRYFAGKTLQSLSSVDIAGYRNHRLRTVGASSIIQDLSLLNQLFEVASSEWEYTIDNPVAKVKRPRPPTERQRVLQKDELEKLLGAAKDSKNSKLYNLYIISITHCHEAWRGCRLKMGAG